MRRLALVLAASACLVGCEGPSVFAPIPERILAAVPLPDEVELARSRLLAALEADRPAQEHVARQFEQLLAARALACTAGNPIGRFDSLETIRRKASDKACFTKHDAQLEEWIAVRRIGLALRAAPLVPAAALPPHALLPNSTEPVASAELAADANVLVLRTHQQRFQVLDVPGGKELASFSVSDGYGRKPSLSPNGRLLAVGGGKTLRIIDVESGRPLWSTDKYQDVVAWGPQWDMVVLTLTGTGAPQLLDMRSGEVQPYPSSQTRLTWSLPAGDGKLWVGNYNSATLMEHTRRQDGQLRVHAARQWTLSGASIQTTPFLMNKGGKLVFASNGNLAWLDLSSGQQGIWQLSVLGGVTYAPVNDTLVAYDTLPSLATPGTTRLFDTDKATIADAKDALDRGQVFTLGPRAGFLRRSANALTLVGAMEGGEPQPAEPLIAEALVAREIAKLNDPYRPDLGATASALARSPQQQAYIDALSAQVRAANVRAAIRDGLPRETIEALRRGDHPRAVAADSYSPPPQVHKPILDIPADARVAMLGVYQAAGSSQRASRTGPIFVNVAPGDKPIVLVLSSYEAVTWMIQPGSRKIAAVLLSGYTPSTVSGQGSAQVLRIGSRHAYKIESREFQELRRDLARYVGNATPVFQGAYEGREFQVQ